MKKQEVLDEMETLDHLGLSKMLTHDAVIIALLKLIIRILADKLGD